MRLEHSLDIAPVPETGWVQPQQHQLGLGVPAQAGKTLKPFGLPSLKGLRLEMLLLISTGCPLEEGEHSSWVEIIHHHATNREH